MKIQNKSKDTKKVSPALIAVIVVVLMLAGAVLAYFYLSRTSSDKTPSGTDNGSGSSQKPDDRQAPTSPSDKQEAPNSDKPSTPTTSNESKQKVQMTASTDVSGDTVFIRGGINYPVEGGSCYAILSGPAGQSTRKDTTILQNPASTDCKTIAIPKSELSSGTWTFTLHYTSDKYEGASDEVSFTI